MANLATFVRDKVGKCGYDIKNFLQGMIKRGELNAYLLEINKKIVESDTEEELVVRIKKGASLTPTDVLPDCRSSLLEDNTTRFKYLFNTKRWGGEFYNDGDSQTTYDNTTIYRLSEQFNLREMSCASDEGIHVPKEVIMGILGVSYDEDWVDDRKEGVRKHLTIEGDRCPLFDKIYEFIRN